MKEYMRRASNQHGFTLIELMITVVIIGILAAIALPVYSQYIIRASREAAQTELVQLANLQEKIYLNSNPNRYTADITAAYNGNSAGGLGKTSGKTNDLKYDLTVEAADPGQFFRLTATPVSGSKQDGDGVIRIDSTGVRLRDSASW